MANFPLETIKWNISDPEWIGLHAKKKPTCILRKFQSTLTLHQSIPFPSTFDPQCLVRLTRVSVVLKHGTLLCPGTIGRGVLQHCEVSHASVQAQLRNVDMMIYNRCDLSSRQTLQWQQMAHDGPMYRCTLFSEVSKIGVMFSMLLSIRHLHVYYLQTKGHFMT